MSIETFGKYVSYLRASRDFSLREFADMIELSPYYLCSIENGRRTNPKIKTLGKMYLALKLRKEEMEKLLDLSDISVLIKSATKFAHRQFGYADKAEFMSLPKKDKTSETRLLNSSEQNILTEQLMNDINPSNAGILLSSVTGMRIGELCALKWSDFDFEKSTVTGSRTMQRIKNRDGQGTKIIVTSPKSRTLLREIPIPEFLKDTLEKIRANDDNFVITGTSKFIEPRTMQYRFKNILKRLNLPQVNFHSLRHMFATKCVSLGIDVKTLSEILGHSSVKITLDRYVHSSMERKQSCMKLFSDNVLAA